MILHVGMIHNVITIINFITVQLNYNQQLFVLVTGPGHASLHIQGKGDRSTLIVTSPHKRRQQRRLCQDLNFQEMTNMRDRVQIYVVQGGSEKR